MERPKNNWSKEDFVSWLHENYPRPKDRLVEFILNIQHDPGLVFECSMSDDYDSCMDELAGELVLCTTEPATAVLAEFPEEPWTLLVRPAKRRKKKQMRLKHPGLS